MRYLLALCLLAPALAAAQSATMSFTVPTAYTSGQAMPASAITGYDVQCSAWTPTGGSRVACAQFAATVLAANATGGVLTGSIPATGGTACFQARTKTAPANSAWSPESCKTFAPLVPNPPGNVTVAVVLGINMAPVYKLTSTGKRSPDPAGFIPVGKACTGNMLFRYRGVAFRKVAQADVLFWETVPADNVAAACA
jgi:hypothetical protein